MHPADLDDALCTSGVIASSGGESETRLPFAVDDAILRGVEGELWAVCRSCHRSDLMATPMLIFLAPVLAGSGEAKY